MAISQTPVTKSPMRDDISIAGRAPEKCATAWRAIIAGALTAMAVSLVLLILGSALGLSAVSPWSNPETVTSFTVKTAIWLIVMQWFSSGIGGYLTGRLRTRWHNTSLDEVFFRDTANGFLAWVVATLLTATILAKVVSAIVSGGVQAGAMVGAGAAANKPPRIESPMNDQNGYYIDSLFRSNTPNADAPVPEVRKETTRILLKDVKNGTVSNQDKAYLTQLVAARTGISTADASTRVDDTIAQLNAAKEEAKQAAEKARKNAMHISLYIALSMVIRAFIAIAAAALGGRHRDEY